MQHHQSSKFLIVGLGNIGKEYEHTRHNIGFDVVANFVQQHGGSFSLQRLAYEATVKYKGKTLVCILPTTYMNLSGRAFKYWQEKEKIQLQNTFTIVDDLALPINKLRIRAKGSSGGQNGLKDIEQVLGTDDFPRLRFGIGSNFARGHQAAYVLSKWTPAEEPTVKHKINACNDIIENFVSVGIEQTMSLYNDKTYN